MLNGILYVPWWGGLLIILATTHITILSVTIYLHRCQAHRALDLHPLASHFFRFWLWLTSGMVTSQWVAIHRKHHAHTEVQEDPHSPYIHGIRKVLFEGTELYRDAADDPDVVKEYGHGVPNDWLEKNLYAKYSFVGVSLLLIIFVVLFGPIGLTYWAIQMAWIPFFAAGLINGAAHYWGYRNFEPQDGSTNLTNFGILIGGEELHNNHHAYPSSAKFSTQWWEFDIGWMYIRLLSFMGLAKVKKVAPRPIQSEINDTLEIDAVRALVTSRLHIMADYTKQVTLPVLKAEMSYADANYRAVLKKIKTALIRERSRISITQLEHMNKILHDNIELKTVYDYQQRLKELWTRQYKNNESIRKELIEWCQEAEKTGIRVLADFAKSLRGYSLAPVYNYA